MNNGLFRRLQIAGLFIISLVGGMVHMALFLAFSDAELFGWAEKLLSALKVEGATLSSVADATILPHIDLMTGGFSYLPILFFGLMMVPVILPLVTARKAWRWVTAILGLGMIVMGIIDGVEHMALPGQVPIGLSGLVLSAIPGIIAVVLAFSWARAKE
jgi:hypothetical protein